MLKWLNAKLPNLQIILKAVEAQKQTKSWLKDGGKYIPYPSTWLYNERWNDEIIDYKEDEPDFKPQTYAQARDAEQRGRSKWLLKEMKKDGKSNEQVDNDGTPKAISELPES